MKSALDRTRGPEVIRGLADAGGIGGLHIQGISKMPKMQEISHVCSFHSPPRMFLGTWLNSAGSELHARGDPSDDFS